MENMISSLNSKIKDQQIEIASLTKQKGDLDENMQDLTKKLMQLQDDKVNEFQDFQGKSKNYETQIETLTRDYEQKIEELTAMYEKQLKSMRQYCDSVNNQCEQLFNTYVPKKND